jgi:hypothetical protein
MEKFLIQEQIIAKKFYEGLLKLINDSSWQNNIICLTKEYPESTDADLHIIPRKIFPGFQEKVYEKIWTLLNSIIKKNNNKKDYNSEDTESSNTPSTENLFSTCHDIILHIEKFLVTSKFEHEEENTRINMLDIPLREIRLLKNQEKYKVAMDILSSTENNNDISLYYRDNKIQKFKFKTHLYNETNESKLNLTEEFLHNIRAFIGSLMCQIHHLMEKIKYSPCPKYIIESQRESYWGHLQMMICPTLIVTMSQINIETILLTFNTMKVSSYTKCSILDCDLEILFFIKFMGNIQPHISKLLDSYTIEFEIEKFLLLILLSYENILNKSEPDKLPYSSNVVTLDTNIVDKYFLIMLIDECFKVLNSEIDLQSNVSSWSLFNLERIFTLNSNINIKLLNEIYNQIIRIIKEKTLYNSVDSKVQELKKTKEFREVTEDEFKKLKNCAEYELRKISNCLRFLMNINWTQETNVHGKSLIGDLLEKKNKLQTLVSRIKV